MLQSKLDGIANNLSTAILQQKEPQIAADAIPSYLILLDSLLVDSPQNKKLLLADSQLYAFYAQYFAPSEQASAVAAMQAFDYAKRACAQVNKRFLNIDQMSIEDSKALIKSFDMQSIDSLTSLLASWAIYIQQHSDNTDNLAALPRLELLANRLLSLDPNYQNAFAHKMLAQFAILLPPAYGGNPKQAKKHFEAAMELTNEKDLSVHVAYAENYARLMFDKTLHDRLLKQVISSPIDQVPALTLFNAIAQRRARTLLAESEEYF